MRSAGIAWLVCGSVGVCSSCACWGIRAPRRPARPGADVSLGARRQQPGFRLAAGHRRIHSLFEPLDFSRESLMLHIHSLFERPEQCAHDPLGTPAKQILHAGRDRRCAYGRVHTAILSRSTIRAIRQRCLLTSPQLRATVGTRNTSRAPGVSSRPPRYPRAAKTGDLMSRRLLAPMLTLALFTLAAPMLAERAPLLAEREPAEADVTFRRSPSFSGLEPGAVRSPQAESSDGHRPDRVRSELRSTVRIWPGSCRPHRRRRSAIRSSTGSTAGARPREQIQSTR